MGLGASLRQEYALRDLLDIEKLGPGRGSE